MKLELQQEGEAKAMKKVRRLLGSRGMENAMQAITSEIPQVSQASTNSSRKPADHESSSFLQHTGIKRFTICFNDGEEDGALVMGTPKPEAEDVLTSIGHVHWALDFQGISVGDSTAPVKFCSPESKASGQQTACGAIPDSGTTLFMAPEKHVQMLYEDICDNWERCRTATSTGLQAKKAEVFLLLLKQCGDWMTHETGLAELPKLHLKLGGSEGQNKTLPLDGVSYVLETLEDEVKTVTQDFLGMSFDLELATGNKTKVCIPAFSPSDMETEQNGPVWILGLPLFYAYTVGYDLDVNAPAVSFSESSSCGCSEKAALISEEKHARMPRQIHRRPRVPSFNLSNGL